MITPEEITIGQRLMLLMRRIKQLFGMLSSTETVVLQ